MLIKKHTKRVRTMKTSKNEHANWLLAGLPQVNPVDGPSPAQETKQTD